MRVLVTGYNGFIGRHLTRRLIEDGHDVFGIDNFSNSELEWDWLDSQLDEIKNRFVDFDITSDDAEYNWLSKEFGEIDVVFHLAAKARVQASFEHPVEWHDTNVTGTLKLLEWCRIEEIKKFIYSSSSSVYGNSHAGTYVGLEEPDELYPSSPYAFQKMQAEGLCRFYQRIFDIHTICLRYFNVYGENQPIFGNYPQLVPTLLNQYKTGQPFTVYGEGTHRRDYTYVGDVVEANILAMNTVFADSTTFNIGTGKNYSVREICDAIDPHHPRLHFPPRIEPVSTLASTDFAKAELEWEAKTNLMGWIKNQL